MLKGGFQTEREKTRKENTLKSIKLTGKSNHTEKCINIVNMVCKPFIIFSMKVKTQTMKANSNYITMLRVR
jgi:hypothetical protein